MLNFRSIVENLLGPAKETWEMNNIYTETDMLQYHLFQRAITPNYSISGDLPVKKRENFQSSNT